jgi:hypothetical protein
MQELEDVQLLACLAGSNGRRDAVCVGGDFIEQFLIPSRPCPLH